MPEIDITLHCPESEYELQSEIEKLNDRWRKYLVSITGREEYAEIFVTDGFYPYYTDQKVKILFIGKEALEIGGANYQEFLYSAYLENKIGSKTLNAHRFHSTMLYIAYALEKMEYDWHNIPYATDFIEDFAKENGISFAFMNLSKFSNESGEWCADKILMQKFIDLSLKSNENLFGSEIDLLHPDIIIGMNFGELKNCLGTFSEIQGFYGDNGDVSVCHLTTQSGKEYLYFDTWHFSSPRKSPERDIFYPLMDALRAYSII